MASRSSGGSAVAFAVFLGVLWLVFFVLTLFFYGQVNGLKALAETADNDRREFVSDSERDRVNVVKAAAQNESVFGYMDDRLSRTMALISGSANTTYEQIQGRIDKLDEDTPLLQFVEQQKSAIGRLNGQITQMAQELTGAVDTLNQQKAAVDQLREQWAQDQAGMQAMIDQLESGTREYHKRLDTTEASMNKRVEEVIAERDTKVAQLESEIAQKDERVLVLEGQVQSLRQQGSGALLLGVPEFSLVDGTILSVNASDRTANINRGRNSKVMLGMTFGVYSDGSAIRPDAAGNYPAPKGVLEIIRVDQSSSTCRILRETRGNPVVRGDAIANPIYDPNKTYKMLVFGNFDTNGDGSPTHVERDGVETQIRSWGGVVVDDLVGDLDFLVLGSRPLLPPKPRSDAPVDVQLAWIRMSQVVDRYDELQRRAEATSIPILNENRLRTLLGL